VDLYLLSNQGKKGKLIKYAQSDGDNNVGMIQRLKPGTYRILVSPTGDMDNTFYSLTIAWLPHGQSPVVVAVPISFSVDTLTDTVARSDVLALLE
jgi:hypothetical protein